MYKYDVHVDGENTSVYFEEFVLHSVSNDIDLVVEIQIILVLYVQEHQSYEDTDQYHWNVVWEKSNQRPKFV